MEGVCNDADTIFIYRFRIKLSYIYSNLCRGDTAGTDNNIWVHVKIPSVAVFDQNICLDHQGNSPDAPDFCCIVCSGTGVPYAGAFPDDCGTGGLCDQLRCLFF